MKFKARLIVLAIVLFSTLASVIAQDATVKEDPAESIKEPVSVENFAAISSTTTGGFWNDPTTWVGGVVPGAGDNVTISAGSTVLIDVSSAIVNNLTVGEATSDPAILTFFGGGKTITVNGDLTVTSGPNFFGTPSTEFGNNSIIIGGSITNNGILDLSTNNGEASAELHFKNATNNTFGGSGSVTDIHSIRIDKGNSPLSTLELTVSNFTVKGSAADGLGHNYLAIVNGTFKISGTFTGSHSTFSSPDYAIPLSAGIWLNNPNYTITAQTGNVSVEGNLTVSAGTYNVGTEATNTLTTGNTGGLITVDGGALNVSGAIRRGNFPADSYRQSAGVTTVCIAGNFAPCFHQASSGTGGKLVIQTGGNGLGPVDFLRNSTSENRTVVTFGNSNTPGTSLFTLEGPGVSLAIDTTAGAHTVRPAFSSARFYDVNIGPGGILDLGTQAADITINGTSFVNNGTLKVTPISRVRFGRDNSPQPMTYSGTGGFSGPITNLDFYVPGITLDPGISNIVTRNVTTRGSITNANKITVGVSGSHGSIAIEGAASFDTAPVWDIGPGDQALSYRSLSSNRTIGPELNPSRTLDYLDIGFSEERTVTVTGGDLTVDGPIWCSAILDLSGNKLRHLSDSSLINGWIRGTVVRRFTPTSSNSYTFKVGENHPAEVTVQPVSAPAAPVEISVTPRDATLAGLPPSTSISYSWDITQAGQMNFITRFRYDNVDINGNEANYRAWRSTGGAPARVSSTVNPDFNELTLPNTADLTGSWGISERLANVDISGTVRMANGAGIRNAIVMITGGNLQSPVLIYTGNFGTYGFTGLEGGYEYTVRVSAKRLRFANATQVVTPTSSITNLDFTANPREEFPK